MGVDQIPFLPVWTSCCTTHAPVNRGSGGVEVVADDFMVVGYGESHEEAVQSNDANLMAFIRCAGRCAERGIKLNPDKATLRLTDVPGM